jgi:hypothetical protein
MLCSVKVSVAIIAGALLVSAWAAKAQEVIEYDGQEYQISVYFGSFAANQATLESQPWWGNQSAADALAQYVSNLPQFTADVSDEGLYFAFLAKTIPNETYFCTGSEASGNGNSTYVFAGSSTGCTETLVSGNLCYAVVTPVGETSTYITASMVAIPCGWRVIRDLRRKQRRE